jgi:hypothetical protein
MNVSNENPVDAVSTPNTPADRHVSEAQLRANKQNAQQSTGAKTEAGRQVSSMNALKHGLTAVAACLPGDNAQDYQCRSQKIPFNPPDFGFDFTSEEWIYFSKRFHEHYTLKHEWLDLNKTLAEYRASQLEPKIA